MLYHSPVSPRRWLVGALAASLVVLAGVPVAAAEAGDRIDRFRALAASRLSAAQLLDGDHVERELWALLDEEIVESLASGSVFASLAFLQDRLDGLADVWGGASFRLTRVGDLTVGAFHLAAPGAVSSVRVYGTPRGEALLLAAFNREGRPSVFSLPGKAGPAQFLIVWEGAPSGRGTRALRVDLARRRGDDVSIAWSTGELFPDGLYARDWRVRGSEIRVRYELHYPGWTPGCERQAEQEDVYRLAADGSGFTRVSRRQHDAWHQALHRSVDRLFAALASRDQAALAALVPDERVRRRLPATLRPEPACDAAEGANPTSVSVAAVTDEHVPWTLVWERAGTRWRLRSASPVLQ